ncbi:SET and MYND domain-containing protein 4-like isoform X4 [Malaya genurostris]|uniref:SET and MYND domain-containing protein 4-like isoform X4 n=1 Tax=Malaya genurostris TaxID=325434 RepID=UPI0026F3F0A9|nr:SET and MYND domain-containing protein 4-like isoform X4 [Malaya genurostris]
MAGAHIPVSDGWCFQLQGVIYLPVRCSTYIMIRPEVVQQLESPAFGLATSWILSRNCVPADSLDEVQRFFQREFWPFPKTHPRKDEILANALRVKANGTYMNKSVEQEVVLRLYNESICHAPDKAEELGIGYANRSAVYFNQKQYNHCLDNILLAKANNYPTSKMQKLLEREQKCLNMMQECSNERKQPVVTDNEQHNSNLEMFLNMNQPIADAITVALATT